MSEFSERDLYFHSQGVPEGVLFLRRLRGREALSELFECELTLETTRDGALEPEQFDGLLNQPCTVAFGADQAPCFHGILRAVTMASFGDPGDRVTYQAVMVPRVWLATQSRRSRVWQDLTVPGIVKTVLEETGLEEGRDFDLYLDRRHPQREYVVQYDETDYDFVARLMEYEGIFWFFDHTGERDRLVVADANEAFRRLEGRTSIGYLPRAGVTDPAGSVHALTRRVERQPRQVILREYNYRTPSAALTAEATIDPGGSGIQAYYGEHYKTHEDGLRLARLRAEEIHCRREVYEGRSLVRGLHAGHRFALEGHPLDVLDMDYVVTAVTHAVDQAAIALQGTVDERTQPSLKSGGDGYRNTFTAMPYRVPYRPARSTPWPVIQGVMNARIDGIHDGAAAPLDDLGRYKVLLPFDQAGRPGGRASRWIRMAQPHAGPNFGMHLPLHVGAEVLLSHVDGDPDRPVIVGAVANPETIAPVVRANATQGVIRTRSGITICFENAARWRHPLPEHRDGQGTQGTQGTQETHGTHALPGRPR